MQVLGIDANQQDGVTQIARYAKDAGIEFPILKDVNNVLADQLAVQRTTEVLVLDQERTIRYRGRVDDQYNVGISRTKSTKNDLSTALEELLAGKPVSQATTTAVGCYIGRVHKPATTGAVTFAKDVARIFNRRCVECHRPGEIGPFSLTSYDEAVGWADTIGEVVREGRMPPWHADPKYGHFANDSRLSAEEKKTIADWIEAGTPEGDPKDTPAAPTFAAGWRIPKPDVVFQVPKPYKVKATGTIEYQFFVIDTGFTEDKWVQAAEVKPSCRAAVHHVLVFTQTVDQPLVLGPEAFNPQRGGGPRGGGQGGGGPRGGGQRVAVKRVVDRAAAVKEAADPAMVGSSASGLPRACPAPNRCGCRRDWPSVCRRARGWCFKFTTLPPAPRKRTSARSASCSPTPRLCAKKS